MSGSGGDKPQKDIKPEAGKKSEKKSKIPWQKIKTEYITGEVTYQELADKYGISIGQIKKQARKSKNKQGWVALKGKHRNLVVTNAVQKTAAKQARAMISDMERLSNAAKELIGYVEQATTELKSYVVQNETVTRQTEYDNSVKRPTKETVTTQHDAVICADGLVNTKNLKDLAATIEKLQGVLNTDETAARVGGVIEIPAMVVPTPPPVPDEVTQIKPPAADKLQPGEIIPGAVARQKIGGAKNG